MQQAPAIKIPPPGQLLIILGWYVLLFAMSAIDTGEEAVDKLNDPAMLTIMRVAQVIGVVVVFIIPVVLLALLARAERAGYFNLGQRLNALSFITALTICIVALPAVAGLSELNLQLSLPESMAALENWMKVKEEAAKKVTELFLSDKSLRGLITNLYVVALMAALSEEIFFRAGIQRLLLDNKINPHLAVWLTAILFSAIHIEFYGFIPRVFLGAILGYLYLFTNNLWVPILAHFCNNAFAVVITFYYNQSLDATLPGDMDKQLDWRGVMLSIALVGVQLYFLKRRQDKDRQLNNDFYN